MEGCCERDESDGEEKSEEGGSHLGPIAGGDLIFLSERLNTRLFSVWNCGLCFFRKKKMKMQQVFILIFRVAPSTTGSMEKTENLHQGTCIVRIKPTMTECSKQDRDIECPKG